MLNRQKNQNNISHLNNEDRVEIVFYADPLCCWSYVQLLELNKLEAEFPDQISLKYRMGGLIKNWDNAFDPIHNVKNPSQMGPIWMEASQLTEVDFHHDLWAVDPPSSSYPACIAVKTAGLQSGKAEAAYFQKIAEAAMLHGKNIAEAETLVQVAEELHQEQPGIFDLADFLKSYNNEQSRDAFRQDLQAVRSHRISRFPTITLSFDQKTIACTGYRKYGVLADAFQHISANNMVG